MKSTVVNNFIDNKIRSKILENKSIPDIVAILTEKIDDTIESQKLRPALKRHMISFYTKRSNDLITFRRNRNFTHLSNNKLFNLIRLRDKLIGVEEFDISVNNIIEQ